MDRFGRIIAETAVDGYKTPGWFSFSGRIPRLEFLRRAGLVLLTLGVLFLFLNKQGEGSLWAGATHYGVWGWLVLAPLLFVLFWCLASAVITRFQDLGFSPPYIIILAIPILNVFIAFMLIFFTGEDTPNRFGWPPPRRKPGRLPTMPPPR